MVDQENIENIKKEMWKRLARYDEMGFKSYNEFYIYMNNDPKKWKSPNEPLHPLDLKATTYWLSLEFLEKGDIVYFDDKQYTVGEFVEDEARMLQPNKGRPKKMPKTAFFLYCGKYGWQYDAGEDDENGDCALVMKYFGCMDKLIPDQDVIPYFCDIDYENAGEEEIEEQEERAKQFFDPELFGNNGLKIVKEKYNISNKDRAREVDQENIDNVKQELLKRLAKYDDMGFESYDEFETYMDKDPKRWRSPDEPLHFMDLKGETYWLPISMFEKGDTVYANGTLLTVIDKESVGRYIEACTLQSNEGDTVKMPGSTMFMYCGKYGWQIDDCKDDEYGNDLMLMKYFGREKELVDRRGFFEAVLGIKGE